jgi:gluconate 2-dehydrogenase gamma chain
MDRRDALRLLATGAALQLAPRRLFAALREARAVLGTPAAPRTLDGHQYATVRAMAEMILPKTETPGATDVGVSEFIDLILTEWYDQEERATFLSGLADVDTRSKTLFEKSFADCAPAQQAEILRALGEEMTEQADAARDSVRKYRGSSPKPDKSFYYRMRQLTLTGYYTSEGGASRELDFQVIPGSYEGCAVAHADGKGTESQ